MQVRCPECGAIWTEGHTCEDDFYQFGYWELADMAHLGVVHHLMVLSYHLQHPSLYSPEGLAGAKGLLVDFVVREMSPQQTRKRDRPKVDSSVRKYKITGTSEAHGAYAHPLTWTMRAADVVAGGKEHYVENIRAWTQSNYEVLKASNNLAAV